LAPQWTWSSGGGGGNLQYRYRLGNPDLSAQATVSDTLYTPPSNLSGGPHTLYVSERDEANNWSKNGSFTIRIDTTAPGAPKIDSIPYSPLNTLRPKVTWRSGAGGARRYRVRFEDSDLVGQPERTDTVFFPQSNLSEGIRTFYVQERDSAGNWSRSESSQVHLALREVVGNRAFSQEHSVANKIVFGSSGTPYILCRTSGGHGHVMSLFGNTWGMIGNATIGTLDMTFAGLVITKQEIPMIAYSESHRESSWVRVEAGLLGYRNGTWAKESISLGRDVEIKKIALDQAGNPVVAARNYGDSEPSNLFVKRWTGSAWQQIGNLQPISQYISPQYIDLAFNGSGDAFFSFYNAANDDVSVIRCESGGSSWSYLGGENPLGLKAYTLSMVLDRQGDPTLAIDYSQTIRVAKFKNGSWSVVPGPSESCGGNFSFAIDTRNNPILGFSKCSSTEFKIMSNVAGNWILMGTSGGLPSQISEIEAASISINPTGVPMLSFTDKAVGSRVTVSKLSFDP
jgi:hypothetical protein